MRKPIAPLAGISALILDMDGVLYRGDRPVEGAQKAVESLRRDGKKLVFVTNNSTSTRAGYARKLTKMGIPTRGSEVVTSGYATAMYLQDTCPNAKVHVLGGDGLRSELRMAGLELVSQKNATEATHVVAGLDRSINYGKIAGGLRALLAGAEFVATNADSTYPTEAGLSPGAGAIVGALEGCSGRKPGLVVGKPSPRILNIALKLLGTRPSETAIIGDRIDTDVAAGRRAGLRTILVLSGACAKKDAQRLKGSDSGPDFVLESIAEVAN